MERRLKPYVLWALVACEGSGAADVVTGALWDADAGVRTMATLEAGALRIQTARGSLEAAAEERNPNVSAAAAWALTRLDAGAAAERLRSRLGLTGAASQVALIAAQDDPVTLARALFSADGALRLTAASLLAKAPRPLPPDAVPAPRWPFSAKEYLSLWLAAVLARADTDAARITMLWPKVQEATLALLSADASQALVTLKSLAPHAGGLVPSALRERAPCLPPELAVELAAALREPLGSFAQSSDAALRNRALALLVASGREEHPAVLQALQEPGDPAFLAMLEAWERGSPRSAQARALLLRAFDAAQTWPLRRRIARVLGPALGPERLQREPVELVRLSAEARAPEPAARCPEPASPGVTN
jgi:hypothetical protein